MPLHPIRFVDGPLRGQEMDWEDPYGVPNSVIHVDRWAYTRSPGRLPDFDKGERFEYLWLGH